MHSLTCHVLRGTGRLLSCVKGGTYKRLTQGRLQLTTQQHGPDAGGANGDSNCLLALRLGILTDLKLGECGVPTGGYLLPNQ